MTGSRIYQTGPMSEHPNDVTKEGLTQIEAEVAAAKEVYAAAQAAGDRCGNGRRFA
jgi:hypothetical protein